MSTVQFERRAATAVLTISRPEKLNALDNPTIEQLDRHLDLIEEDDEIRAVVITGAGDRAFSAGADIAGFSVPMGQSPEVALRRFVRKGQALTNRIEAFPKPVLAAVNGIAFGGGCELMESTHITIACEDAIFAKPEINLGIIPAFGGTQRMPRLIGRKQAIQMILTGTPISAREAVNLGLINEIVDRAKLLDRTLEIARFIAEKSPIAVTAAINAISRGLNMGIEEGMRAEAAYFARVAASDDAREGISAFLGKRQASFRGK